MATTATATTNDITLIKQMSNSILGLSTKDCFCIHSMATSIEPWLGLFYSEDACSNAERLPDLLEAAMLYLTFVDGIKSDIFETYAEARADIWDNQTGQFEPNHLMDYISNYFKQLDEDSPLV